MNRLSTQKQAKRNLIMTVVMTLLMFVGIGYLIVVERYVSLLIFVPLLGMSFWMLRRLRAELREDRAENAEAIKRQAGER
ncbi:hypothetical protein [Saccharibacillus brassicae]|uniref:Uncharacterized protein n=1 Tax=Saccharibacillus brassicae TaxID=2583377 RepID=A0A4Y6UWW8_SACBS|nr:hypothetical protein [Saccharibacillus brassicae]QDH22203.1 hypothetical protein FFV09_15950 [Saccharibacillus brassicae]